MLKKFLRRINRYINRMKASLAYITKHPLTKNHVIQAYFRYFAFHIFQLLNGKKPKKYHFFDGLDFYASMGDAGIVGNIYTGLADFEEMSFLLHFLRSDDLFVDIGANVGAYSLLASGVCKSKTIAIEPIPETFEKLMANVQLNDLTNLVECLNIGLGSSETELDFVNTPNSVMNRVSVSNEDSTNSRILVKVMPLDLLVSLKKPSLLKIDVEGFEMEVIKGAGQCISDDACKAIIIELNGSGEKYGYKDTQTHSLLISYGFKPYKYQPFSRNFIESNEFEQEGKNVIFIRDLESVLTRNVNAPKRKILSDWI